MISKKIKNFLDEYVAETHENGVIDVMAPNLRPLDQSASTGGLK